MQYNYTDNTVAAAEYFYRLKMIDRNGSFKYSGVIRIALPCFKFSNSISVIPNPAKTGQQFKLKIVSDRNITRGIVRIMNTLGQTVHTYPVVVRSGTNFITYPSVALSAGTYLIELSEDNKNIDIFKMVIQ
ncbi:MAG: T9SS type A sorting domain-containing protein [Ferruginibacter sp.]